MVDSWYCLDRVVPEGMSQVSRRSEVGNHKRRSLNTQLSSGTSVGTFACPAGPYRKCWGEAGTKNEPNRYFVPDQKNGFCLLNTHSSRADYSRKLLVFRLLCHHTASSSTPAPMNHVKIFKGWPPQDAPSRLVQLWYKSFPPDHVVWWKWKTQPDWVIKPVTHDLVRRIRFWRIKICETWF